MRNSLYVSNDGCLRIRAPWIPTYLRSIFIVFFQCPSVQNFFTGGPAFSKERRLKHLIFFSVRHVGHLCHNIIKACCDNIRQPCASDGFFQGGHWVCFQIFPGGAKVVKFVFSHLKLIKQRFCWKFQNPGRPRPPLLRRPCHQPIFSDIMTELTIFFGHLKKVPFMTEKSSIKNICFVGKHVVQYFLWFEKPRCCLLVEKWANTQLKNFQLATNTRTYKQNDETN